jgi:hypothetical protein
MSTLGEIRARSESASAGPWDNFPSDTFPLYIVGVPTGDDHYADVIAQMDEDYSMLHEFHEVDVDFICAARTDVPMLVAALDAVLAIHGPYEDDPGTCRGCGLDRFERGIDWPCEAVRAIREALA